MVSTNGIVDRLSRCHHYPTKQGWELVSLYRELIYEGIRQGQTEAEITQAILSRVDHVCDHKCEED